MPSPQTALLPSLAAPEWSDGRLTGTRCTDAGPAQKNVNKNSFVHNSIPGSICYGDARDLALSDKAVAWECRNFDGAVTQCFSLRLDEAARELSGRMRGEAVDTDRED